MRGRDRLGRDCGEVTCSEPTGTGADVSAWRAVFG
jgi:hypothetical protein